MAAMRLQAGMGPAWPVAPSMGLASGVKSCQWAVPSWAQVMPSVQARRIRPWALIAIEGYLRVRLSPGAEVLAPGESDAAGCVAKRTFPEVSHAYASEF